MSESIEVVATFVAKPGQGEQLEEILAGALASVRAEDGCLRYDFFRVRRDDTAFITALGFDQQTGAWPLALFTPICDQDGQHAGGAGFKWV